MRKETFTLNSSDGSSKLAGFLFLPEGEPRAVVQICHGMCEYILRYEEMAQYLTDAGYAVCGIDHLGHGSTAEMNEGGLGYFGEKGAWNNLVEDQEVVPRSAVFPAGTQHGLLCSTAVCRPLRKKSAGIADQRYCRQEPRRRARQGAGGIGYAVRR